MTQYPIVPIEIFHMDHMVHIICSILYEPNDAFNMQGTTVKVAISLSLFLLLSSGIIFIVTNETF